MINTDTYKVENADAFLQIIGDAYSPEMVRDRLNEIIFKYNLMHIEKFSQSGNSRQAGMEAIEELELLKAIADSLKSIKIIKI